MTRGASISLSVEGASLHFELSACTIDERVGAPFVVRVRGDILERGAPVPAVGLDLLGRPASLVLRASGEERRFEGIVEELLDHEDHSEIILMASVAEAGFGRDYRVLPGASAIEVAREILEARGVRIEDRTRRAPPPRAQWVQSFESDLAFVSRVLAEEGLSWVAATGERDLVRVADEPGSFEDTGLILQHREDAGLMGGPALLFSSVERRAASDAASVRGYDFERPQLDIEGESGEGGLEWYEFSRDARSPAEAAAIASIRLGELRRDARVLSGEATSPAIAAGSIVKVEGAPRPDHEGRFSCSPCFTR